MLYNTVIAKENGIWGILGRSVWRRAFKIKGGGRYNTAIVGESSNRVLPGSFAEQVVLDRVVVFVIEGGVVLKGGNMNWRATWAELLTMAMEEHDESLADIVSTTLTEGQMNRKFHPSMPPREGVPFTAWTERRVYFPVCFDGAEWVESVPRRPGDEAVYVEG